MLVVLRMALAFLRTSRARVGAGLDEGSHESLPDRSEPGERKRGHDAEIRTDEVEADAGRKRSDVLLRQARVGARGAR